MFNRFKRYDNAITNDTDTLEFKCISNKYGNFIKDKIYIGKATGRRLDKQYTDFFIHDEDDDKYYINSKDLNKLFIINR